MVEIPTGANVDLLSNNEAIYKALTQKIASTVRAYPDQVGNYLNNPIFESRLSSYLGDRARISSQVSTGVTAANGIVSPQTNVASSPAPKTGAILSGNSNREYGNLPTEYTKKFIKNNESELKDIVSKMEGQTGRVNDLAEMIKKCQSDPSPKNVSDLQNSLVKDWRKSVSKKGSADGDFGPMTLTAIKEIAVSFDIAKKDEGTGVIQSVASTPKNPAIGNAVAAPTTVPSVAAQNSSVLESGNMSEAVAPLNQPSTSQDTTLSTSNQSTEKAGEVARLNAIGKEVLANNQILKNKIETIRVGANFFNAGGKIDQATEVFEKYLNTNAQNLSELAEAQSKVDPKIKTQIAREMNELGVILQKGAVAPFATPASKEKMQAWIPQITELHKKLSQA